MSINISEVIWTIICFFALLFVLKTFLFTPILRHMEDRRSRVEAGLAEGQRAREARELARARAEESGREREQEARDLVARGREEDARQRAAALDEARRRGAETLESARSQIEGEEREARAALKDRRGELARDLAESLLGTQEGGGHDR